MSQPASVTPSSLNKLEVSNETAGHFQRDALRARWATELNTLRSLGSNAADHMARIASLQTFLSMLDPLRKLERDPRTSQALRRALRIELSRVAKSLLLVSRDVTIVEALRVLTGRAVATSGEFVIVGDRFTRQMGLRGENGAAMIAELLAKDLLRLGRMKVLHITDAGVLLMAKHRNDHIDQAISSKGDATLQAAIDAEVLVALQRIGATHVSGSAF